MMRNTLPPLASNELFGGKISFIIANGEVMLSSLVLHLSAKRIQKRAV
jgi:hypothetical protein